ncbi:unnamed protein product [Durusdinium trenchii]|uniref:Uncharacterized protein n=1 Tax=Durusdinium trenchii TaxID=1381693 RepID=A0ABP0K3R0_9DINO
MPSVCTFRGVEPCMMTPVKLHRCSTCGWPCWMCVQCLNARWCPRCGRCLGDCFSDVEEELLEELRMEYFRSVPTDDGSASSPTDDHDRSATAQSTGGSTTESTGAISQKTSSLDEYCDASPAERTFTDEGGLPTGPT